MARFNWDAKNNTTVYAGGILRGGAKERYNVTETTETLGNNTDENAENNINNVPPHDTPPPVIHGEMPQPPDPESTIENLKAFAQHYNIDLASATKKHEIHATIVNAIEKIKVPVENISNA